MTEPIAAESAYQARRQALWEIATRTLTEAARMRHPQHGQLDFADFVASALAATAANVGGVGQVLAGRAGSWEADLVGSLINGTVPDEPDELARHRTEPVVVPLNVAELVEGRHQGTGLDDALAAVTERHAEPVEDDEESTDAYEAEVTATEARYAAAYARYAEQFAQAVQAEAATIPGLQVPVTVEADTNPTSEWWAETTLRNPVLYGDEFVTDPLVWRLWEHAERTVPLPDLEEPQPQESR